MKRAFARRNKVLVAELRKARQDAGLTQVQLAARLEVQQATISKIERGEMKLDVPGFADWCTITRADPLAILRRIRQ